MSKMRMIDARLMRKDWFVRLSPDDRDLFMFTLFEAEQSGVYVPDQQLTFNRLYNDGKKIDVDSFIERVNKDGAGNYVLRIKVLENNHWLFVDQFVANLGECFRPKSGAHRGALKILLTNKIPLSDIRGFMWRGLENAPYETLYDISRGRANGRSIVELSEAEIFSWVRRTIKEKI